jgi:PRTase ComF-like
VKYILNSEPNSFKIFIQNHSDSFLELLYNMAIGNSYHTIEAYQENLNLLRLQVLMISQIQNIEA